MSYILLDFCHILPLGVLALDLSLLWKTHQLMSFLKFRYQCTLDFQCQISKKLFQYWSPGFELAFFCNYLAFIHCLPAFIDIWQTLARQKIVAEIQNRVLRKDSHLFRYHGLSLNFCVYVQVLLHFTTLNFFIDSMSEWIVDALYLHTYCYQLNLYVF